MAPYVPSEGLEIEVRFSLRPRIQSGYLVINDTTFHTISGYGPELGCAARSGGGLVEVD
jgi:hypothetical protein